MVDLVFEKVPFEQFFQESTTQGFINPENKNIAYIIWNNLKAIKVTNNTCKIYSPWPFYLSKEKTVDLPTGFIFFLKDKERITIRDSKFFTYNNSIENNKHHVISITAKHNICIGDGDCIMTFDIKEGSQK